MSNKNNAKDGGDSYDDDIDAFDDIDIPDDEILDNNKSTEYYFDARRRLEKVLEDRELQRLISGDFY